MSSPPPVIFKRKTKPATRTRQTSPENVGAVETENSPSTLAIKLKNKIKKTSKTKSRLSFGGDGDNDEDEGGDGEVFKVKKSSLSRKMALGTHPAIVPQSLDQATISTSNGSPRYDAAYLKELKASTPTSRPPLPTNVDPYDADMSMDIGDISIQTIDMDVDSQRGKTEESASFIPSESSIKVAKEKRGRLRQTQATGEEDFISLSVAKLEDGPKGPHPESRLMREEDELGEGDDEFAEYTSAQERIALGKKSRKKEASQRRVAMEEMIADAEEEDEETMEWEHEQLRRGGHRTPEPSSSKVKEIYKAAPIPLATPIPLLGPAISRISEQLSLLTASHAKNSATLTSLAQERSEVDDRETEMRELVEKAETKRAWFDGFKEWNESVAGFLDEKYPLLEKLEEENLSLLKERFDMVEKRRRQDDEDDLATFIGPLPITPSSSTLEPEETDELGRTIPKPNPANERRQRRVDRTARHQLRSSRRTKPPAPSSGLGEDEEGYSTDSSLAAADASAYTVAMHDLSSRRKAVLADVKAEEFKDPGKGRWSVWREKYSDSYIGAWGGLGVVSVWEFWVRLECVGWDCIENQQTLHSFKWYKGLYEYCRPGDEDKVVEERELGPDGDLVTSMISTAVIPLICKLIDGGALDVYSSKHIRRMVDLAEEVEASVEQGGGKFQTLLKSVAGCFQAAISATEESVVKYTQTQSRAAGFNPDAIPARRRFLNRRVKLMKNLLRWRKYTGERFGLGTILAQLIERSIVPVAEGGWEVGGEDIVRKVVNMVPAELVPPQLRRLRAV
ncbi:hypothetical protein M413DRAFT_69575 [Hebeloma cylindrosporum]|uniref:GCF C-terminal domain-containing protein n=1 Tax=Hebeloma cylindrosporum TaxID=76867 RepID=A0A0C2YPN1_HEBCY|nr:hypothetical protein M413DRAFT_69575 [Hebeloma cylindrosporum h7]